MLLTYGRARWVAIVTAAAVTAPLRAAPAVPPFGGVELATQALAWACSDASAPRPPLAAGRHERSQLRRGGREVGTRDQFHLQAGGVLEVRKVAPAGRRVAVLVRFDDRVGDSMQPRWLMTTRPDCRPREVLRLRYRADGPAEYIDRFDADMLTVLSSEPLDAALPDTLPAEAHESSVRVALVDSGVNYTLPIIASRLARGDAGRPLGYDFRDMDPRPFDHDVRRSPFFVQRHGTRTAYLLLAEAPVASLVPYRFPRGHMGRMRELVESAQAARVRVMNLSLGGPDPAPWRAFEAAARAAPEILFVASAGNDGRDLDASPIYPAAFDLPNLVSVTSADPGGALARGSNWGARHVDLLVGAESAVTIGFDGHARFAAGSSYAAPRVAALAACLAGADPDATGAELRGQLLALATPGPADAASQVAAGHLAENVMRAARGACPAQASATQRVGQRNQPLTAQPESAERMRRRELNGWATLRMKPSLVLFEGGRWQPAAALAAAQQAASILAQCAIVLDAVELVTLAVPREQRLLESSWSEPMLLAAAVGRPAAVFVDDTLHTPAFDAESVSVNNGKLRPGMVGSVWLTAGISDPGVALAHELVHVLSNSGSHSPNSSNLMHERTSPAATRLRDEQCDRVRHVGQAFGWLQAQLP